MAVVTAVMKHSFLQLLGALSTVTVYNWVLLQELFSGFPKVLLSGVAYMKWPIDVTTLDTLTQLGTPLKAIPASEFMRYSDPLILMGADPEIISQ